MIYDLTPKVQIEDSTSSLWTQHMILQTNKKKVYSIQFSGKNLNVQKHNMLKQAQDSVFIRKIEYW